MFNKKKKEKIVPSIGIARTAPYDQREKVQSLSLFITIVNRGQGKYYNDKETWLSLNLSIQSLSLFITIVNRGQGKYYIDKFNESQVSLSLSFYAYTTPNEDLDRILGNDENERDLLMAVCRNDDLQVLKKIVTERFKISKATKGIAFALPIDSIGGIAAYKFLSDQNRTVRLYTDDKRK